MVLSGLVLALFFSILLLSKKNKSRADYILFAWMLLIFSHLVLFYINHNGFYKQLPHLLGVDMAFPILQVLFLYFYVRTLTSRYSFHITDLLHLLPSLAAYFYMIPFFMKRGTEKVAYLENIRNSERLFLGIFTLYAIIAGVIYIFLSFRMIEKYKEFLGQNHSNTQRINLKWMKNILIGMSGIWLVFLCVKILQTSRGINLSYTTDYLIFISAAFFVSTLGYFGIRQTNIFTDNINPSPNRDEFKERYQKSGLKEEQVHSIKKNLISLMETEKKYLDSKLTLDQLAKEININPNYLSQVINEQFSKNFYDFVNYYRIEDFKQKATNRRYKHYSILALAFECGFNSKSAFYAIFKKSTGITPSEFLKSNS